MLLLIQRIICHGLSFFRSLQVTFGEPSDLVIVYDAHKGINLCAFLLYRNLKKNHKSCLIEDSFHSCARAYTPIEFNYHMRKLNNISPTIRHDWRIWLANRGMLGPFSKGKDIPWQSIYLHESLNSWLKEARELHIISLYRIYSWFGSKMVSEVSNVHIFPHMLRI